MLNCREGKVHSSLIITAVVTLFFVEPMSCLAKSAQLVADSGYEEQTVLQSTDLVKEVALTGDLYRIDPQVQADGFLLKFTIRSDFGTFYPESPELLKMTLVEIAAIDQLEKISKSEIFVEGLSETATELGKEIVTVVTEPVETVKGIGSGIGRFFQRTYRTTKTGMQRIGDKLFEEEESSAQPSSSAKIPGAVSEEKKDKEGNVVTAGLSMAGNTAINILGYDDHRRHLAKQLQVDPYTTNKVLADKLDGVAWAAFAGGLGVRAVKMALPATMVISATTTLSGWVWDMPPGDLKVYNEDRLLAMGVDQEQIDLFLRNRWYTRTLQGRLVRGLDRIIGAENRPDVLDFALTVQSETQARFIVETVELLALHHEQIAPLSKLEVHTTVIGYYEEGAMVVPAPLDYVLWTKRLDTFTSRDEFKNKNRLIYLRGELSAMAKKKLAKKGWRVKGNVTKH